ncbi:MAG: IclR family transcriptional regulator [Deltaproteobacteria bacterium]|nr:IclR family transcriptional regulator [Deltaproteobacteria bacterium]
MDPLVRLSDRGVTSQTLIRGLRVLEALAQDGPTTLADLVRQVDLPKTVALRLLKTLTAEGYAVRLAPGRYALGLQTVRLSAAGRNALGVNRLALPHMVELARTTRCSVNLNLLDRMRWVAVCVESVEGLDRMRFSMHLGRVGLLHAGATRKVILAYMSEGERQAAIALHGLPALTPQTCVDRDALEDQLRAIRQRGWEVTRGESDPGGTACASPVFAGVGGQVVGSLGILAANHRLPPARVDEFLPNVIEAGQAITEAFGAINDGPATTGRIPE